MYHAYVMFGTIWRRVGSASSVKAAKRKATAYTKKMYGRSSIIVRDGMVEHACHMSYAELWIKKAVWVKVEHTYAHEPIQRNYPSVDYKKLQANDKD